MPDKRAWLRAQGFTVGERGRFSAEMKDALAASGIDFDDNVIHTKHGDVKIVKKERKERTNKPKLPAPEIGWVDLADIRRPDQPARYIVHVPAGDGRKAHTTEWSVCWKCGYSLQFCRDPEPIIPPWMIEANVTLDIE